MNQEEWGQMAKLEIVETGEIMALSPKRPLCAAKSKAPLDLRVKKETRAAWVLWALPVGTALQVCVDPRVSVVFPAKRVWQGQRVRRELQERWEHVDLKVPLDAMAPTESEVTTVLPETTVTPVSPDSEVDVVFLELRVPKVLPVSREKWVPPAL